MFSRTLSRKRVNFLLENDVRSSASDVFDSQGVETSSVSKPRRGFSLYLRQANLSIHPILFVFLVLTISFLILGLGIRYFSFYLSPVFLVASLFFVYLWIERRIEARASLFASEYPSVLLATASSVRAGMTPYAALERSVRLLDDNSLVRHEVEVLLDSLRRGQSREIAIAGFGLEVRQPDVQLFRDAFGLVLEHGGRFAPTLERLAKVCRERSTLIRSATVTTATMRMTANILLLVTPLVLGLVSTRTDDFWELFFENPLANTLGTIGISMIVLSYALLIKMSAFKA